MVGLDCSVVGWDCSVVGWDCSVVRRAWGAELICGTAVDAPPQLRVKLATILNFANSKATFSQLF